MYIHDLHIIVTFHLTKYEENSIIKIWNIFKGRFYSSHENDKKKFRMYQDKSYFYDY